MVVPFQTFVLAQAIGIAALNTACNGAYTWIMWRSEASLPLFGEGGIAIDLASTPVWIAALSTLLGLASVRKQLRAGTVALPGAAVRSLAPSLPSGVAVRAVVLALLAGAAFGLPIAMMLHASGLDTVSPTFAVLLKVALTVPLTLVIVPLVTLTAVADVRAEDFRLNRAAHR